jgi:predicted ATPase
MPNDTVKMTLGAKESKAASASSFGANRHALIDISIEGLFGRFTYGPLPIGRDSGVSSNLTILFGDNGTGKSTLLKILFAALSPNTNEGLRTYLAKTPFRKLKINLTDDNSIEILKFEPLIGNYSYIFEINKKIYKYDVICDIDGSVKKQDSVFYIEQHLKYLNINILFVSHMRMILSTFKILSSDHDGPNRSYMAEAFVHQRAYSKSKYRIDDEVVPGFPLTEVISELVNWFRTMAIRQGYTGDQDASQVYLDVIGALTRSHSNGKVSPSPTIASISQALRELQKRADTYINHGLLSDYKFEGLNKAISKAPESKAEEIYSVINPFLDSISRRLSAFKEIESIINDFEVEINKYFYDKNIFIDILGGLVIYLKDQKDNKPIHIDADKLSSGERQLLFLFCTTLLIRDKGGLILIDEPELSLNYKWQRIIISSILKLSSKRTTQFLMASHSIEVITKHKAAAVELKR